MHGKSEPAGRGTGRMATKEQLRLALATQDVGDEDRSRVQKMIKEIVEATRCSQAEAELALHDASNNVDIAVSNILDNAKLDTWSHYSKKGPKGKEEREEPKKGGNRPDRRAGNKRDFQQKGGRGTENGNESRENRQPRNKEDGETRGPRKPQERLRRDPNVKREGKKPNAEQKEESDDHWKNGPLVFNRRENIDEKDLHAVEPTTTIKPIAQPTPAGPLSYADVLRKTKPQPPPPVLAESPFKKLQVGSDAKQTPASPHLANADGLHTDENDFLAETLKSPHQPSHHLDESLLHEDTPPIAFGSQPSAQKVQQSLTEQLKNDLGLVNLGAAAPPKKYHDSLHQSKASTHKAGVVEFLTSNAPATASSSDWQFGFEATPVPQSTVADVFRREPTSKMNEPVRTETLPKILNQYVQQPPQQNSQQQSYSHQQFNRNRNGANNLPFANNNYSDNFNPDLRSNNYGAPSSPPKSQPPLASQLQNNHHIFQQPAQPLYPSYPYLANMYSPVAAGFRDDISMLPFQNNIYPMNLDAIIMPQIANATSAGPLQSNQSQHHQNSHQQASVQQGLQQNSQNQQNQRNDYTENLFMNKTMSIPSSQQNNGSSHNQQNSNLGNNQQQQRQSLMDNNPQGSVAPPPGFGNAPFIAQRNLFQNSFQMPFNQFPIQMLPGLLREENAVLSNDRKRKKDPKDNKKRDALAPQIDRIPLPNLPASVVENRRHIQREAQKKPKISPSNPPNICLYTILNSPNGVCSATFSEGLGSLAIGYGNSSIQLHALGVKAFRQLKSAEELDALDSEYEDISEAMYDDTTKAETIELNGHLNSVHSVSFSCDSRLLLSGSRDETVRLWNLDLRRNIVIYRADAPVWDAKFSSRGLYFASATASKCVSLYSTERIHPLRIFTDATEDVTCLDFHNNSNFVVGGSDDNNIYVWDILTGSAVQTYSGHKSIVHSVKFSPDGRTIVSASADGTLCVWDTIQQKLMAVQECDSMPFKVPIVFSPDSSVIAVGTPEHAVTFFNVDSVVSNFNGVESRNNPDGFPMLSYPTKKTSFLDLSFSRKNTVVGVGVFDQ